MRFVGIWYNMHGEVKRDYVSANDSSVASELIHEIYRQSKEPADCLTVIPADQSSYGSRSVTVDTRGGSSWI